MLEKTILMNKLPSLYQEIIHLSRYARFIPSENRRETWKETVDRLITYIAHKTTPMIAIEDAGHHIDILEEIQKAILTLEVMPSMRLLMVAGEACERDNISAYNCSYLAVNNKRAFSEGLYILMNGTGVGFSCEKDEVSKLPLIPNELKQVDDTIVVGDSKLGWAKAYKKLISSLYEGDIPSIDYSRVRAAGERLKVFGGRASGPEPLKRLFDFTISSFKIAVGRKLNSLEVHDIMCMVGEIVVVGGVRRSALISLSDLDDIKMRNAKAGAWWETASWRGLANNSATYTEKPDAETFLEEWLSLVKSKSGERGIFSRAASQRQASKWNRRPANLAYGTNPCSEIILRDKQFCNLTEVVVRSTDNFKDLKRKVELATILGTIQSTFTDFQFLSEDWKKNTEEERLLGVSLTGIMDHPILNGSIKLEEVLNDSDFEFCLEYVLSELRDHARSVNEYWAEKLGINPSVSITCVKPSGTVSQLVDSASGIHARHNPFYIRRIRMDKKDPIYQYLKEKGCEVEDEVHRPDSTAVFSFAMKAPEGAICRKDTTAIEQLELWLLYQRHWCEHKPSVTITVKDEEWPEVGAWVYKHFDEMSGVSFLPFADHTYQQAPYEDLTDEQYNAMLKTYSIDWSQFKEELDNTGGSQELACSAGNCEVNFL